MRVLILCLLSLSAQSNAQLFQACVAALTPNQQEALNLCLNEPAN